MTIETGPRIRTPDPAVRQLIAALAGAPALETMPAAEARAAMAAATPLLCPNVPPCDQARFELGKVPIRSFRPPSAADRTLPALLFFHGGGWTMGDMDAYAPLCAALALEADICVLSVDYRLAPEYPFPAGFEDAQAVAAALDTEADKLGVDRGLLGVGGDSAGGNLAAALCLARRETGVPPYRLQLLLYPIVDARLDQPSYREFGEGWFLTASTMRWFRDLYLGASGAIDDWRVSPLAAERLDGLPPAHIVTCGLDPLQDEARAFADRLEDAGVAVVRRFYPDQIHGFLFMGRAIPAARPALREIAADLGRALRG